MASSPVTVASCNIHATEIGASQMAVELAYRMATDDSRWTQNVLDNVVLRRALAQSGRAVIVTDWNDRVRRTENVWSSLPWLYHSLATTTTATPT
ncbi:MAG: M14 family zinc carboxypeptidase [Bryobacterales bacterium]